MTSVRGRVLIVEGRFYEEIGQELFNGATRALESEGWAHHHIVVPGAMEIPGAVRLAVRSMEVGAPNGYYAGFITLGCVVRGETDHYDHVCRCAIDGMMDLTLKYSLAHGCGILTVESRDQARVRADVAGKDFGGRAARACLRMIEIKQHFKLG